LWRDTRLGAVSRRLFSLARLTVVAAVAAVFAPIGGTASGDNAAAPTAAPATAPAAAAVAAAKPAGTGIPSEVAEALKALKAPAPAEREKQYAVLNEKGDARIIPALRAFLGGQLQLRDDKLILYGKVNESKGDDGTIVRTFPVFDALTNEPIPGPDGKPLIEKINLSKAFRAPLTAGQKERVLDLIATLSLLHPDPEVRLASIRDASERASRAFPDPDDEKDMVSALKAYTEQARTTVAVPAATQPAAAVAGASPAEQELLAAIDAALIAKPAGLLSPLPTEESVSAVGAALAKAVEADKAKGSDPTTLPVADRAAAGAKTRLADAVTKYKDRLGTLKKNTEDLGKYAAAFDRQLAAEPNGPFATVLRESKALTDAVLKDKPEQKGEREAAVKLLGDLGTSRAANVLRKLYDAAVRTADAPLAGLVGPSLGKAESYQTKVRLVQYTFAGLSTGSIYVLLALGLAIIFGLMGVINMAHGEFMMVGAFTTYAVAQWFRTSLPGAYDWFPVAAVPAAFAVAGVVGLLTEYLVIRHLYGRTTETLIATIGVGLILVQVARVYFGDNLAYNAPRWMQGSMEVAPDLLLNRARFWTIAYCGLCVTIVYLIVNKTKLGLLLRATTQNRKMAAALGVPTRLVDAMTFAFGAGLAGMAGVVVPMIDKINPGMGQDYIVSSFMVVVVGGVGKLAGAIVAGFGLGAIGNYLEPFLGSFVMFAKTSSVLSKVLVLSAVVLFLQWRPSGLFPPKGRVADA
jgi:urea transport system permease protein